ncbi:adhesion G protein-coupled receptor B3-like isoform X2 [Mytilus californianus]|uniref:adhesion G protein-coupled receptor B3-like isoform X2 n=1 Tax=Mytilus californianus TaxID=6549 RepID=UPI002248719C|nr:adhesion G protein-coupled receptor B3-like isoform X2 [Mytilus californianus]
MHVDIIVIVLILIILKSVDGSHFLGGMITWKHTDNQQIEITCRVSFRRDFSNHFCDEYNIFNTDVPLSGVGGELDCYRGCNSVLLADLSCYCTDFSEKDNWTFGQRTVNFSLPKTSDDIYQFRYSGSAWIDIIGGGSAWSLLSTVNISKRQDTGKINSPPTSSVPPFIQLKQGCFYVLTIPVEDGDNDIIGCRWASGSSECGGVCNNLINSELNKDACVISYNTTVDQSLYAVALQIEDFATEQRDNHLSSVPLQFVIDVTQNDSNESCELKPELANINSNVVIPVNTTYHQTIIAIGAGISEINVLTSTEISKSRLLKYGTSNDRWYVNVTWTPTEMDIGNHSLCYTAFDSISQASEKKCTTVYVTNSTNICRENLDKFNTKWNIAAANTHATLACTGEYTGNASRYCDNDGKWEEPNYINCISKSIQNLKDQTVKLLSGESDDTLVSTILRDLENITKGKHGLRSGDLLTSSAVLNDIAKYVTEHTEKLTVDQLQIFGSLCDNILDDSNHQSWEKLNNEGLGGVTSLVNAVTEYNNAFNNVVDGKFSIIVEKENVVIEVGKASSDEIIVPDRSKTSDSWIADSATEIKLKTNRCSGLTGYSSTFYRNISRLFPEYLILNGEIQSFNGSYDVNSIIADFTIHGRSCSNFSLLIKFDHILGDYSRPFCGFWDFSAPNTVNGAWSSFGSQVVDATDSYTICEYNHTTNFAILMSPGRTPLSHQLPLSLISAIGSGVSILFLVITVVVHFVLWKYVANDRTKTLMNLCVALILSYFIFLAGITRTENKVRTYSY